MCFLVAALTHLFSREKGATASAIVELLCSWGTAAARHCLDVFSDDDVEANP